MEMICLDDMNKDQLDAVMAAVRDESNGSLITAFEAMRTLDDIIGNKLVITGIGSYNLLIDETGRIGLCKRWFGDDFIDEKEEMIRDDVGIAQTLVCIALSKRRICDERLYELAREYLPEAFLKQS